MSPSKVTLKQIMSIPLLTIDEESSVAGAISLMRSKHIRRLPVTRKMSTRENSNIVDIVTHVYNRRES